LVVTNRKNSFNMSKPNNIEEQLLEERKVKALEKIAKILDQLTLWFEEIDKEEWGERMQFYLAEFLSRSPQPPQEEEEEDES